MESKDTGRKAGSQSIGELVIDEMQIEHEISITREEQARLGRLSAAMVCYEQKLLLDLYEARKRNSKLRVGEAPATNGALGVDAAKAH